VDVAVKKQYNKIVEVIQDVLVVSPVRVLGVGDVADLDVDHRVGVAVNNVQQTLDTQGV